MYSHAYVTLQEKEYRRSAFIRSSGLSFKGKRKLVVSICGNNFVSQHY